MKILMLFVGWCVLLALCWPLALVAVVLLPLIWLISIPVRLVVAIVHAALALVRAILFLPARVFGYRNHA